MLDAPALKSLYTRMPGGEAAVLGQLQQDGVYTPVNLTSAQRRPLTFRQQVALAEANIIGNFINWDIWAADLGVSEPKVGDRVTDAAGVVWTIQMIELTLLKQRYRCTAVMDR